MRKEVIKEIIVSFQRKGLPKVVRRDLRLPVNSGKIVTVVGVRRSGKTYLLYQAIRELRERVNPENVVYINFDDERLDFRKEELNLILEAYRELYPEKDLSEVYFFFDEVQNVEGWEKFVKRVYETETKNLFITGSSSKLLSTEIATVLRGRAITYEVYPLSFREFLRFKNLEVAPTDLYDVSIKGRVKKLFEEFLLWGGFPELSFMEDEEVKLKTLQEYFEVMLFRDLVERFSLKNLPVVKYFLKRAVESVSSPFSVNNVFNELKSAGYKVSKDTLYFLLDATESVYFLRLLERFSRSVLKREFGQKKLYVVDNGLIKAVSFFKDKGKLLENLIFRELLLKYGRLFFYKEKKECDFVAFKGETPYLFQVAYTVEEKRTLEREVGALLEACKFFSKKEGVILTYDEEGKVEKEGIKIRILPAWKFLLFGD